MRIAIVTGASSGLGREYARWVNEHRAQGRGFDELWLIARRKQRLDDLARELDIATRVCPLDLSSREGIDELSTALAEAARENRSHGDFEIGFLVNAAGYGRFQYIEDMSVDDIEQMVNLNCRAVVEVTRICLPYLRRGARVLQIASCAAFQPLQGMSEYAASKSFVLSYTRSQRWELMGRGIYMTAVCPIWVKTEFNQVASGGAPSATPAAGNGIAPGDSFRSDADRTEKKAEQPRLTVAHTFPNLSARRVVEWSTFVNSLNYPVATCDVVPFVMRVAGKVLPAPVVMAAWEGLRRI